MMGNTGSSRISDTSITGNKRPPRHETAKLPRTRSLSSAVNQTPPSSRAEPKTPNPRQPLGAPARPMLKSTHNTPDQAKKAQDQDVAENKEPGRPVDLSNLRPDDLSNLMATDPEAFDKLAGDTLELVSERDLLSLMATDPKAFDNLVAEAASNEG